MHGYNHLKKNGFNLNLYMCFNFLDGRHLILFLSKWQEKNWERLYYLAFIHCKFKNTTRVITQNNRFCSRQTHNLSGVRFLNTALLNGINGRTHRWIQNFLTNRSQCVVIGGEKSPYVPVSSGVPQGSVLGPLLFLIYINDLPSHVQSKVRLFADDTVIYLTVKSENDSKQLQRDLTRLERWERDWQMMFNPSKCNVIKITRKRKPSDFTYTLHGQILETIDHIKYLGVHLSRDLRWNEHVAKVTSKANRTLGFLRRNLRTPSIKIKEAAYKTLVRPAVEYCSSVWDPYTAKNISQVEMVQRRAARWILRRYDRRDSVTEMLQLLDWETLEKRRSNARLCYLFKQANGLIYGESELLQPVNHNCNTRYSEHSYRLPPCSRDYYKYSFYPRTIKQWNNLPSQNYQLCNSEIL